MKDCKCGYCMGGEILAGFGIKICELSASQLILFKEQSRPGRVIVAYKDHVSELVDISEEDREKYMQLINMISELAQDIRAKMAPHFTVTEDGDTVVVRFEMSKEDMLTFFICSTCK